MVRRKKFLLKLPTRTLTLGEQTLIMGVLNVTPDSFSDGGRFLDPDSAFEQALAMERDGADIIDIGGESTRPGSAGVGTKEELDRVLPVLEKLRGRLKIPISIDTSKLEVAEAASATGAEIINDVTALRRDPRLPDLARRRKMPLILMHMRGEPRTMQKLPFARNVLKDVMTGLKKAVAVARKAGVPRSQIVVDPGIGFGKSAEQNLELIARLPEIARLGYPILIGTSRKSFLARILGETPGGSSEEERLWATAGTVAASILQGAHIVRVHDVVQMAKVVRVVDAVANANKASRGKKS